MNGLVHVAASHSSHSGTTAHSATGLPQLPLQLLLGREQGGEDQGTLSHPGMR